MIKANSGVYLGEAGDRRAPLASPIYADLTGFGPIYIQVGGDEVLLDDSRRLHNRAIECGVKSRIEVFPAMQHIFHIMAGHAPEAEDGVDRFATWIKNDVGFVRRSEEHTSELQSLMRLSYAVFCLKKKNQPTSTKNA